MKKWKSLAVGIIILLFIAACNGTSISRHENEIQIATPSVIVLPTEMPRFASEIQMSQDKWVATAIRNYHIRISFYENFANGLKTERDVIVTDSEIADSFCISDKCPAFVLADIYTIDDLFEVATGATLVRIGFTDTLASTYDSCIRGLSFDKDYGFPKSMTFDCPGMADEEHSFQVTLFELIE